MEKMDTDVWVQRVKDCYLNFASVYYHFFDSISGVYRVKVWC